MPEATYTYPLRLWALCIIKYRHSWPFDKIIIVIGHYIQAYC